jgi:hypothetical protein
MLYLEYCFDECNAQRYGSFEKKMIVLAPLRMTKAALCGLDECKPRAQIPSLLVCYMPVCACASVLTSPVERKSDSEMGGMGGGDKPLILH